MLIVLQVTTPAPAPWLTSSLMEDCIASSAVAATLPDGSYAVLGPTMTSTRVVPMTYFDANDTEPPLLTLYGNQDVTVDVFSNTYQVGTPSHLYCTAFGKLSFCAVMPQQYS